MFISFISFDNLDIASPERETQLNGHLAVPMTAPRASSSPPVPTSSLAPPSHRMHLDIDTNVPRLPYRNARSMTPSPRTAMSRYGPYTPHTTMTTHMPSFSLIGALEFRQVVSSLQQQAAGNQLNIFDVRTPVTPFPGGHYYARTRFNSSASHPQLSLLPAQERRRTQSHAHVQRYSMYEPDLRARSRSPFDWLRRRFSTYTAPSTPTVERPEPDRRRRLFAAGSQSSVDEATLVDVQEHSPEGQSGEANTSGSRDSQHTFDIPRIAHIPPSPIQRGPPSRTSSVSDADIDEPGAGTPYLTIPQRFSFHRDHDDNTLLEAHESSGKRHWCKNALYHTVHVLFPTLRNFGEKSFLGIVASILAAPAVLALTLTLPVHVQPREDVWGEEKLDDGSVAERLIDFEEDGVRRALTAEDEVRAEMQGGELQYNRYLFATQLICGPLFCVSVVCAGLDRLNWILLATGVAGLAGALLTLLFSDKGNNTTGIGARCAMGFIVAVVWIMAIADEVVNVLKVRVVVSISSYHANRRPIVFS